MATTKKQNQASGSKKSSRKHKVNLKNLAPSREALSKDQAEAIKGGEFTIKKTN